MSQDSTSTMQVLSPEGALAPPEPVVPAKGLSDLHGRNVAFLSNTKPNIDLLLRTYAELLRERYETGATHQRKANAAIGAGSLIEDLAGPADAAVTGVADCGACTAQTARDTVAFEARGVPTVIVTTAAFEPLAVHQTRYCGAQQVRMLVLPHPFDVLSPAEVVERANATFGDLVTLLTNGAGRDVS